MSGPAWQAILHQFRGAVRPPDGGLTDGQLLSRWLASRDEAAFELLVWRHGPTVRGVCRRLLRRPQDIDDAFQATFLVFLRKAATIGKRDAVGSWLYGVAYRVALRARLRSPREEPLDGGDVLVPAAPAADAAAWGEVRRVLDEEVNRLPRRYRAVFVLRCLQGKTNEEAARELGVPAGTVQSRLSRARERLRSRLTRRGVTLTAGALGAGWAGEASATLPGAFVRCTVRAALSGAAGQAAAAGLVTTQAASLAKGALHAMWMTKVQMTAAVVLGVALLGGGAFTYHTLAAGPGDGPAPAGPDQPARQGPGKERPPEVAPDPFQGPRAEDPRLKGRLDPAALGKQELQEELRRQRALLEKYRDDIAVVTGRINELEEQLRRTRPDVDRTAGGPVREAPRETGSASRPAAIDPPPTGGGPVLRTPPGPAMPRPEVSMPPAGVAPGTVQAAQDGVEILQAQLQVKKAELQGAMAEQRAAQRNLARARGLPQGTPAHTEVLINAEEKAGKAEAAVQVKEAEVQEQQLRLQQATRRLEQLRPAKEAPKPPPHAGGQPQLQEIRQDLERLLQKVESLEKSGGPPGPGPNRQ
ncbi:MAG TPA: sigma-70 family RNA polymerase sigma factor [Gemmataceae bacterium]|nr:sigma-70 family RNA polymerase sigma factor [Gemmataceae bacterium]